MKLLAILLPLLSLQQAPPQDETKALYESPNLEIKFAYPKTWQVTTNRKGESRFLIPVEGSPQRAVLEISPVNFRGEKEVWQLSQAGISKSMKRAVDRQWEEEILGVPLLLTRTNFTERSTPQVTETGLVYSLSRFKLMYRLTALPDDFDKANYEWRQVMQTIRTEDDTLPKPENPSVPMAPIISGKDDLPYSTRRNKLDPKRRNEIVKAPVATAIEISNRKLELRTPAGWTVEPGSEGVLTLKNPALSAPVRVEVRTMLDSDAPMTALIKSSGASLGEFATVDSRQDTQPRPNRAGASISDVFRSGKGSGGSLFTYDAYGQSEEVYFLLGYRGDATRAAAERKVLSDLLEQMSVEVAK